MSLDIGDVNLRFEAPGERRSAAERLGAELSAALPDALQTALAAHADTPGVAIVPRVRMNVRAALGRVHGRDLARRIADACLEAIVAESSTLGASPGDRHEGTAERTLRALTVLDGVRVDAATEAAAWLIALVRDERTVLRRATPYADLEYLTSAVAFVEICARAGARAVLIALGSVWAVALALRCSDADASRLLALLDDGSEPTAHTWRMLKAFRDERRVPVPGADAERRAEGPEWTSSAGIGLADGRPVSQPSTFVLALLIAIEGVFERYPGAVAAAKAVAQSERLPQLPAVDSPAHIDGATNSDEPPAAGPVSSKAQLESTCTGFWLLLPHLARRLWDFDEETARAITLAVAERLCETGAAGDPAIVAFVGERQAAALRLAVPPEVRIDRLSIAVVRDFVRTLHRFERARCGYVLRAMLAGPGLVWRTDAGWAATLPQSPLRIVLERAALLGELTTPWGEPELAVGDP